MKIFISYSHEDIGIAEKIVNHLKQAGHDIWIDKWKIEVGDNIINKINEGINNADAIIIIFSKNSLNSKWVLREFSAMVLGDISRESRKVIPILIDKVSVPSYLSNYQYLDLSSNFEDNINNLINALSGNVVHQHEEFLNELSYDKDLISLEKALSEGRLTLVCGAGVSISAGIPTWNELLNKLLETMMKRISNNHNITINFENTSDFNSRYSNLIIGKYLKNNLGKEFQNEVRNALYSGSLGSNRIIESITNISRPQRDRKPLDSIITFNFDSLIEEYLSSNSVKNRSIYCEGIKHKSDEIPIYHVHGFLPRLGDIPIESNIVFSEDSYHSQFIEPFSWSNLIQLNKLSQNTCLFIGLSLTDPNLRRLLDVSIRKNPDKNLNHYIIKKIPITIENGRESIDKLAYLLEEQDANELGLNVIWIRSFEEISTFLNKINNIY
ncbi:TIR domain-containing protein [Paenibacillus macquariensis]|uniref:SIR2-like domain-containing protein n=1 Tax=Paenibacillus macquariensis TaxID=948756 RepID=A0ABY1JM22_9BACL|nr:TIR domain-containing protein [Paenibacillus macquariensis]MEC0090602.1 TIR domain-containing protein [Paenibacillus macquariensis]OAB25023.1 molecular chaperone Tir [Paenibacillus macquariensis subsp. macquariensis]SIQ44651.1 SIR2-like domain-containing protein [Paenibacillus macquariensis]